MYFEEIRSEKKNPLQFAIALVAALMINGVIAATMANSGVDDRMARDASAAPQIVADLGTLPAITVLGRRS